MPKFAARVDGNQAQIVAALRQIGASVVTCHAVGQGFPDISVGYNGATYLLEIKDPSKPIRDQALTPSQVRFHEAWRGHVAVVKSVPEALEAIGVKWKGTIG